MFPGAGLMTFGIEGRSGNPRTSLYPKDTGSS